jgi:two-component system sensor histidine kinase/response regulator
MDLKQILNRLDMQVWQVTADLNYRWCNPAHARFTGTLLNCAEVISVDELAQEQTRRALRELADECLEVGQLVQRPCTLHDMTGRARELVVSGQVSNDQEQPTLWFWAQDAACDAATARGATQHLGTLQALLGTVPAGAMVFGRDNRLLHWNKRLVEMWGLPAHALDDGGSANHVIRLMTEKVADPETFKLLLNDDPFIDDESTDMILLKEGRTLERRCGVYRCDDEVVARAWVFTDRTAEQQRRIQSEQSHQLLQTMLDNLPDVVKVQSPDHVVLSCNRAACKVYGMEASEMIGRRCHELVGRNSPCPSCPSALAVQTKQTQHAERYVPVMQRWVSTISTPVFDALGNVSMVIEQVRDITEAKQRLEQLDQAKATAEAAMREMQQALAQANKLAAEAEQADEAKTRFLANVSHEIRTPLNGVLGMTTLLMDEPLGDQQQQFVRTIRACGKQLLGLINDVLDFSKMEAGRMELEASPFCPRQAIEEVLDIAMVRASENKLNLACLVDPRLPNALVGDVGRIKQVLLNLLDNALKFTAKGGVTLTVRPQQREGQRLYVQFAVRDTGIGISQDCQQRLFRAFTQGDPSTTRKYGGTGLGLAICRQLIEQMGGRITLSSREARGTVFCVTVPLHVQAPPFAEQPLNDMLEGQTVVVVDQERVHRRWIKAALKRMQANVIPCAGERELRQVIAGDQVDRITQVWLRNDLDGVSGSALYGELSQDPRLEHVRFVLMGPMHSAYRDPPRVLQAPGGRLDLPLKLSQLRQMLGLVADEKDTPDVRRDPERAYGHILVVDDNMTNMRVAQAMIEKLGYLVDGVANGEEAIAALGRVAYDLVFMDAQMPVMDGFEATQRIRQGSGQVINPRVPIVAMTAHVMKQDHDHCLEAGMNDYIGKPIALSSLTQKIRRWLHGDTRKSPKAAGQTGAPAARPQVVPFDAADLMRRLLDDREIAETVIEQYAATAGQDIEQLQRAYDQTDERTLCDRAHALRGASANVGAKAMEQLTRQIELEGPTMDHRALGELVAQLPVAFDAFRDAVAAGELRAAVTKELVS